MIFDPGSNIVKISYSTYKSVVNNLTYEDFVEIKTPDFYLWSLRFEIQQLVGTTIYNDDLICSVDISAEDYNGSKELIKRLMVSMRSCSTWDYINWDFGKDLLKNIKRISIKQHWVDLMKEGIQKRARYDFIAFISPYRSQ